MKDERLVRAIVVFGDIRGFRGYMRRISHPPTQFRPFWKDWDELVNEFEDRTGYFVKRLGDGFMAVEELEEGQEILPVIELLNNALEIAKKATALINKKPSPRPDGFRIRAVCDYVFKVPSRQFRYDYVGDKVNFTETIMRHFKEKLFICHESVKELLTEKQIRASGFKFKKIKFTNGGTSDMYGPDMYALWELTKGK